MIERLLVLVAVALVVAIAVVAVQWWTRARLQTLQTSPSTSLWNALDATPDGRPTIVSFSSPGCGVCRATQQPAIEQVEATLGNERVRVVKIDVAAKPDVANAFGVLTVPTTVVLTANGRVLTANNGFAPFPRLVEQVQAARLAS